MGAEGLHSFSFPFAPRSGGSEFWIISDPSVKYIYISASFGRGLLQVTIWNILFFFPFLLFGDVNEYITSI